jgi:hypothetical protein
MRPTSETSLLRRPARLALTLVLLLLLVPLAAGCGGGGNEGGGGKEGDKGKTGTDRTTTRGAKPGPKPKPGSMIQNFAVNVASPTSATVTARLTKASELNLRVRKVAGSETTRVGRVPLGQKPAGNLSVPWNLKVEGKQLAAGRYEVALRGRGAGQSRPLTITVPG